MSYNQNFQITQGVTFDKYVYIQEQSPEGGPLNLSNYLLSGNIQYQYAPPNSNLASFGATVYDGINGQVRLVLSATETSNLPVDRLVYQVYAYAYSVPVISRKILHGYVDVYPGVNTVIPSGLPTGCVPVTVVSGVTGYFAINDGVQVFRGFTGMRASVSYYDAKAVYTSYGVSPGDGLAGWFQYDVSLTNPDNNVDYIKPNAIPSGSPGRYQRMS